MLVTGRPITGERAYQIGLVNVVCESAEEVLGAATALAQELAAGAPLVPQRPSHCWPRRRMMPLYAAIEREREVATELFASEDGREGFASFVGRRPPRFSTERP